MRFASAAFIALLAACTSSAPDSADTSQAAAPRDTASPSPATASTRIALRTDTNQYAPGAKMTLTLVNKTDGTYAFNPCTRILQREVNGDWTPVPEPQRICTMEAWLLEPRATRSGDTELLPETEPGRYRVAVSLGLQGQTPAAEHELAVSEPFTVAR